MRRGSGTQRRGRTCCGPRVGSDLLFRGKIPEHAATCLEGPGRCSLEQGPSLKGSLKQIPPELRCQRFGRQPARGSPCTTAAYAAARRFTSPSRRPEWTSSSWHPCCNTPPRAVRYPLVAAGHAGSPLSTRVGRRLYLRKGEGNNFRRGCPERRQAHRATRWAAS